MPVPSRKVAVVSEDAQLTESCASVLRQEGYTVRTVRHSGHALLACLSDEPIDVLIADLSMDEGSGPSLARRMRRFNPNLRAIYIADSDAALADEGVLVRPFSPDDLLKRLEPGRPPLPSERVHPSAYF
jgi:DNA-binding response OmpR family regulator